MLPVLEGPPPRWGKVVDHARCIGCHACTTACRSENAVPLGVTRTYVKAVDVGVFPDVRRNYQVTRCNQCTDAPCVAACPTSAMYRRRDGIVDFDKDSCIGCKACIAACPYDAIFINPDDHTAEKCNLCAHRLDTGLEPACVVVCPVGAILVGDLDDPTSEVARIVDAFPVAVRKPEKQTRPNLFYNGVTEATLDPLAARRPEGGLYMWSEQGDGVRSGNPSGISSAAAVLAYDVPHRRPWDWRVGLYTWTKSIAAGAYLVAALSGQVGDRTPILIALAFLALTGAVLVWDLEQPARFHYIFLKPQWRSWLVRGGVIIGAYGAVLAGGAIGLPRGALGIAGVPLAVMTAVYTGYLLRQAKARDLWQSRWLVPHLLVQAVVAGAAVLLLVDDSGGRLVWTLAAATAAHLGLVAVELRFPHPGEHTRLALISLLRARSFQFGVALGAVGLLAPGVGAVAAPFALLGLLLYELAYIEAGQAVPLA